MTLYVDPPEGWRYGFPKAVPKDREADLLEWIVEQGYPKDLVFDGTGTIRLAIRCWRKGETHMSDELREKRPLLMRVLEAMQEADNYYVSADQAQVAIALIRAETLEEAAKCADRYEIPMCETSASHIAAAIRALKERT